MRVLCACEESQAVCREFRALGHEAYSCDLLPCSGKHPEWHLQQDVIPLLNQPRWDLVVCFPPCTHLAVSGAKWFKEKRKDGRQQAAIDFFMEFTRCACPQVAIENPIGIMSTIYRKPDQIIQPWQYNHMERKATCLWLKGLPKLEPTRNVYNAMLKRPMKKQMRLFNLPPSDDRAKIRSRTFSGFAKAMANQWSNLGVYESKI